MPNRAVVYAFSDSTRKAYTAAVTQAGILIFAAENSSLPVVVVPTGAEACRARKGVSKVKVPLHTHPAVPGAVQTGKSIMICW